MIICYILILINILVFIMVNSGKIDVDDYCLSYYYVSVKKEYWRLITSSFVHESFYHLLLNMISLYNIYSTLIYVYDSFTILLMYLLTSVCGHIISITMRHNNQDDNTCSIGASGGICGLIGIFLIAAYLAFGREAISEILRSMVSIVLVSIAPGVDGKSHISCLAIGLVIGFILFRIMY